jgi:hypothetical protein
MNMTFTYWYRKNPTIHTQKSEDINRMYEKTPPNKGCINSIIGMRALRTHQFASSQKEISGFGCL